MALDNFIATLESWGLMDVMIPFFILLIILFFLAWALLNFTKLKLTSKIIISIVLSLTLSIVFVGGHITGLFPLGSTTINFINMSLPQVILYPILYLIALFPLIVINNKIIFNISVLLIFIILSVVNTSNIILLLLPLSIVALVYDRGDQIIQSAYIQILSITIFLIGLISIISLFLIKKTNFYNFVSNFFGIKLLYLILILWIILWITQILVLYKKEEPVL